METDAIIYIRDGDQFPEDADYALGKEYDVLPDDTDMYDILTNYGFFRSRTNARASKWDADIKPGFHEYVVGKRRRKLIIYKGRVWSDAELAEMGALDK